MPITGNHEWSINRTIRTVNPRIRIQAIATFVLLVSPVPVSVPRLFGFAEIARGSLLLQTTAAFSYDSYFLGSIDNDPDTYVSVQPVLQYLRQAGRGEISASAGVAIIRYHENDRYDAEDVSANLRIALPAAIGARIDGTFALGYSENTDIDYFVNDRIPARHLNGSLNFTYKLGVRTAIRESFSYHAVKRDGDTYSDQDKITNRLFFDYNDFLRGTDLSLGYTYTDTRSSGDNYLGAKLDQDDHAFSLTLSRPVYGEILGSATYGYHFFHRSAAETASGRTRRERSYFSLGLRGPFLPKTRFPKLESSASLSYRQDYSPGINDAGGDTLTGDIRVAWDLRSRTNIALSAGRSMSLTASDLSATSTNVAATVTERIGLVTTAIATVSYHWVDYRGIDRKDRMLQASLSLNRPFNKYWSAGLSYQYQRNDDTSSGFQPGPYPGRDYDRHVATLSIINTF